MHSLSILLCLLVIAYLWWTYKSETLSDGQDDSVYGPWVSVGECVSTDGSPLECGVGYSKQVRVLENPEVTPAHGNEMLYREITCSSNQCKTDGVLGEWTNVGECSATCGDGLQHQVRTYIPPRYGGTNPVDYKTLTRDVTCSKPACPVDGSFTDWENVGTCSAQCGVGSQQQSRTYTPALNGGVEQADKAVLTRSIECKLQDCPVDGSWSEWTFDGACQVSNTDNTIVPCGQGVQRQTRVYTPATNGGNELSGESTRWIPCSGSSCPRNGICSEPVVGTCGMIANESSCSVQRLKTRTYTPPVNGGADVPCVTSEWETCDSMVLPSVAGTTLGGKCISDDTFVVVGEVDCSPEKGNARVGARIYTYTGSIGKSKWMTDSQQSALYSLKVGERVSSTLVSGIASVIGANVKELIGDVYVTRTSAVGVYPIVISVRVERVACAAIPYRNEEDINVLTMSALGGTCGFADMGGFATIGGDLSSSAAGPLLYTASDDDTKKWIRSKLVNSMASMWTKCFSKSTAKIIYYDGLLRYPNVIGGDDVIRNVYYKPVNQNITMLTNGNCVLVFQTDGNLVLYRGGTPLWASGTQYKATYLYRAQGADNDWCLTDSNFNRIFNFGLGNKSPTERLAISNQGEFAIVDTDPVYGKMKVSAFINFTFNDQFDRNYDKFPNYVCYNDGNLYKLVDESWGTKTCSSSSSCDGFNTQWGLPILDKKTDDAPMTTGGWRLLDIDLNKFTVTSRAVGVSNMKFTSSTNESAARAQTIFYGSFYKLSGLIKYHRKDDTSLLGSLTGITNATYTVYWLPFYTKKGRDEFRSNYNDFIVNTFPISSTTDWPSIYYTL